MVTILSQIRSALEDKGVVNVCTAYDAVPIREKGEYFVVVGAGEYEALTPIYTAEKIFMPVKCDVVFTVYAPKNITQDQLYGYYQYNLESTINNLCGICTRLKSIDTGYDSKTDRLTLKAVMKTSCMKTIER